MLSLIIPCRYEGASISPILKALTQRLSAIPHEILVVCDDPADPTFSHADGCIKVINRDVGVGGAIRAGIQQSHGEFIALCVADDIGMTSCLPFMHERLTQGFDVVGASRYLKGGGIHGGGRLSQMLSLLGNRVFQWLTGSSVTDATCGIKLFKRDILKEIQLHEPTWALALELTAKAQSHNLRISEVAFVSQNRLLQAPHPWRILKRLPPYLKLLLWATCQPRPSKAYQPAAA